MSEVSTVASELSLAESERFNGIREELFSARWELLTLYAEHADFENIQDAMDRIDDMSVRIGGIKATHSMPIHDPEREIEVTAVLLAKIEEERVGLAPLKVEAILRSEYERSRAIQWKVEEQMAGMINFPAKWVLFQAAEAISFYQRERRLWGFNRESVELVAAMLDQADNSDEMPNFHLVRNYLPWDPRLDEYTRWLFDEQARLRLPGERWRGPVPKRDTGVPYGWGEIPTRDERPLRTRVWSRLTRRDPWHGLY